MKVVYIGHHAAAPSFYVTKTDEKITGFSKTVEAGDILIFDTQLQKPAYRVLSLTRRDYNGVFKNPEDAKGNHFTAEVVRLAPKEVVELRGDEYKHLFPGHV